MSNPCSNKNLVRNRISLPFTFFNLIRDERHFLLLIAALFFIAVYPIPGIAMWVGFMLTSVSAMINDVQVKFEEHSK